MVNFFQDKSTIDRLQNRYRIVAINLPGAGNTPWYGPDVLFDDLTSTILAVVDGETKGPFGLVGYSTGAMLAIHLAAREPSRVNKLVSIAPWLTHDPRTVFFFDFWERLVTTDLHLFARYNTLTAFSQTAHTYMDTDSFAGTVEAFSNTGFNQDLPKLIRMNRDTVTVQEDLPQITASTMIIGFSDDRICPISYARQVAKGIAGAKFVQIEAGHGGPWEATEAMNKAIDEALS